MMNITISHLDDGTRTCLRDRPAGHSRSAQEVSRLLICGAVGHARRPWYSATVIRSHVGRANRVDLALRPREHGREPSVVA